MAAFCCPEADTATGMHHPLVRAPDMGAPLIPTWEFLMSEPATEPAAPPEPAQPVEPGAEPTPAQPGVVEPAEPAPAAEPDKAGEKDWAAEVAKWKAHARKHEQAAKANATAAQKYAEWEESQKTEQQRLADAKASADRELADLRSKNARLMAAAVHNLPPDLIDFLGSGTEEEIDERAKTLAAKLAAVAPAPATAEPSRPAPTATRPVESLTPGAQPSGETELDMNAIIRRMAGRT